MITYLLEKFENAEEAFILSEKIFINERQSRREMSNDLRRVNQTVKTIMEKEKKGESGLQDDKQHLVVNEM